MAIKRYRDCVPNFVEEYKVLTERLPWDFDDERLQKMLVSECNWSERGSAILVWLARQYGTSVLSNALALADALEIEDGEAGI